VPRGFTRISSTNPCGRYAREYDSTAYWAIRADTISVRVVGNMARSLPKILMGKKTAICPKGYWDRRPDPGSF